MQPESSRWVRFAEEDLSMASLALKEGLANQVCFHAQQCCEKLLKAVMANEGRLPPRTHKIADLLGLGGHAFSEKLADQLLLLDRFYIPTRYPDALPGMIEAGLPTGEDAETAVETAHACYECVMKLM